MGVTVASVATGIILAGTVACGGGRKEVSLSYWRPSTAQAIEVGLGSCRADVVEVEAKESETEVRIRVWIKGGMDADCQDTISIDLDEPLGDRQVIDAESGDRVPQEP